MASTPDPLFDLKNLFYLGNWQQCLNEAQKLKITSEQKLERDIFMYRSYIEQRKYIVVLNEINSSSPQPLKAIRLYARYLSQTSERNDIVEELDSNQSIYKDDNISSICAASIYFYEKNYEYALKVLHNSNDIECMATTIQALLLLDRIDLAKKEYKLMCQKDEYHTLSQLCLAWIDIYQGGANLQDAYFIFQELKDKYGATPLLLNGQATVLILQNRLDEVTPILNECIAKDSNYSPAINNQMVLENLMGKTTELTRYINQLSDSVDQTFYHDYEIKQKEFDKLVQQYQIN